jgi:hypothetical protein
MMVACRGLVLLVVLGEDFLSQQVRSETGIGAAAASAH